MALVHHSIQLAALQMLTEQPPLLHLLVLLAMSWSDLLTSLQGRRKQTVQVTKDAYQCAVRLPHSNTHCFVTAVADLTCSMTQRSYTKPSTSFPERPGYRCSCPANGKRGLTKRGFVRRLLAWEQLQEAPSKGLGGAVLGGLTLLTGQVSWTRCLQTPHSLLSSEQDKPHFEDTAKANPRNTLSPPQHTTLILCGPVWLWRAEQAWLGGLQHNLGCFMGWKSQKIVPVSLPYTPYR